MDEKKVEKVELKVEELEERIVPTPLAINPAAANANAPDQFIVPINGPTEVDGINSELGLIAASGQTPVISPG